MDHSTSSSLQLSKHRIEALVDGIFAVAMTLLVIELRLPEHLGSAGQLHEALLALLPNFGSWLVSFVVLGVFWLANHRIYSHVRHVDTALVWWTLLMLGGASLLPFASAVNGRVASQLAQSVYSGVMILTVAGSLMVCRHVHRNPQLCVHPMDAATYRATCARLGGLVVIALVAVALAGLFPGSANFAFLLSFALGPLGRAVQRRSSGVAA
ncbi:MAG: TMEM175 family protein [Telluria sp.]